jgi:hypothetical protein
MPTITSTWMRIAAIGVAGALGAFAIASSRLSSARGDVAALLRVGDRGPSYAFVRRDIPDLPVERGRGYDGQMVYALARVFPHLSEAAPALDAPRYRARRILLPMLASPFGEGRRLAAALLGYNVLACGIAGAALACIAQRIGLPAITGLTVLASPAIFASITSSLNDALAVALCLSAVAVLPASTLWAVVLVTLATLAKETSLAVAFACAMTAPRTKRVRFAVPFLAAGAWMATLVFLVPPPATVPAQLGPPFVAWVDHGLLRPDTALIAAIVGSSAYAAWELRRSLPTLALWIALDALVLVFAGHELIEANQFLRFGTLAYPGLVLALLLRRAETRRSAAIA